MTIRIVNVSGGAASAVCLFRVIERFGKACVNARFADVNQESDDLYRFLGEVEDAAGVPITRLNQGLDCWGVWLREMMFTNPASGGCLASYHLKKVALQKHAESIATPDTSVIYVGFGADEDDRMARIQKRGAPWQFEFPLTWGPVLGRCDVLADLRRRGIEPSKAYSDGYSHDNCRGGCILAGQKQRAQLLIDDPQWYSHDERNEQMFLAELRRRGRKEVTILKDRRGGTTKNLSLKQFREEIESGERKQFDESSRLSCNCVGDLIPD